jgi:hypothetical protein
VARITQAAGRIQTMTLGGVSFGLSREQRAKVEGEAQAQAIERFKARAEELARGFGFSGYSLREVAVNTNEPGFQPRMRMAPRRTPASPPPKRCRCSLAKAPSPSRSRARCNCADRRAGGAGACRCWAQSDSTAAARPLGCAA